MSIWCQMRPASSASAASSSVTAKPGRPSRICHTCGDMPRASGQGAGVQHQRVAVAIEDVAADDLVAETRKRKSPPGLARVAQQADVGIVAVRAIQRSARR